MVPHSVVVRADHHTSFADAYVGPARCARSFPVRSDAAAPRRVRAGQPVPLQQHGVLAARAARLDTGRTRAAADLSRADLQTARHVAERAGDRLSDARAHATQLRP